MTDKTIKILLIEDNPGDIRLIKEMLKEALPVSFELIEARTLQDGLIRLNKQPFNVVLLDLGLPDSQGVNTLKRLLPKARDVAIIVVTGLSDDMAGIQAVRNGAQDYLIKDDINASLLGKSLQYAIERKNAERTILESARLLKEAQSLGRIGNWEYDLATQKISWSDEVYVLYERERSLGPPSVEEEAKYYPPQQAEKLREYAQRVVDTGQKTGYELVAKLPSGKTCFFYATMRPIRDEESRVVRLFGTVQDITERKLHEEQLRQSYEKLRKTLHGSISALSVALEKRDPYTAGHQVRVTRLVSALAEAMNLSEEMQEGIRVAAILHDIGKIVVPTEILSKPARLTYTEFAIVKMHPGAAYEILQSVQFPWPISRIIMQHHERLDGSGYPEGLKGDEIMLEARILAVADVVESMSSHRPYRPALGIEAALDEISEHQGVLYDAAVVEVCLKLFKEKGFRFE